MKKGYKDNIEELTKNNDNFRKVLYTGHNCQLVLMSLLPGEEIGKEVHGENDQFFRFESGAGKVIINETEYAIKDGDAVIVPMGAEHNVINTSQTEPLKLYTIYTPPHHKDGVIRKTKADAEAPENAEEFDGVTTEI
ncbi:MAG TPA: cupin domain-containing protein [Candidatus Paceibacterota bacterium]|nr:cupin domain-containing protein [Candidatus Paceibacterota bacterium]